MPGGVTRLTYTYPLGEELYSGEAVWEELQGSDKYRHDQTIIVRYDPKPGRDLTFQNGKIWTRRF